MPHGSLIERTIAKSIMMNPCKCLLRVYEVTDDYYDVELLYGFYIYPDDKSRILGDIRSCLDALHARDIV